ncbi:Putative 4-hydroxy-4-methyl-2-oxoglutarate aldolase [BD1-7 clade bacterium]|uniref:4-hydroxy-4-methyl-2-oxoglutarate aldolase n=1 Tax=BD1-7 clade bacterium TaxID=2029982 RepID=A0A5S9PNK4_9GAMM|nr:Putative 4-hydroxy-4-methyl-2-oxoglutarate aldolase [BD1-7 clade bacterium]
MDFTTPDLCDDFPSKIVVASPGFRNYGNIPTFGGEIVTVKCFEDNSCVKQLVTQPGAGKVMVVDAGGSLRRACLGDMLAAEAARNGWHGIIMYGCVRDVDLLATIPLGIQALASHPMKTDKKGVGEVGLAVTFHGVTFLPGDYVYADNNGIVVSPEALVR